MKTVIRWTVGIIIALCISGMAISQITPGQKGIGLSASGIKLIGGQGDGCVVSYLAGISARVVFTSSLTGEFTAGLGWVRPRDPESHFKVLPGAGYRTYLWPWSISLRYHILPDQRLVPFAGLGVGLTHWNLRDFSGSEDKWFPIPQSGTSVHGPQTNISLVGSLGATYFMTEKWGLELALRYSQLLGQDKDNIGTGDANTGLAEIRLGLVYHFGGFRDSDNDGIADRYDVYPDLPEDYDGFQDSDGAPDLDNDKDGVPDAQDGAPDQPEDIDGFQDDDGIPDMDNDNDGIEDARDGSPNEPEDIDGFEDEDGIPDLDNDKDGIPDLLDQCPNQPETFNGYIDEDGCPDTRTGETAEPIAWEATSIPEAGSSMVLEGVTFETGSATLTAGSITILDNVYQSLIDHPEVEIEIRGYTDAVGSAATNLDLSQRRADSVMDYLINRGIDFNRLRAIGYGEANPIAPNDTPEGRAQNRRIEFLHIEH